MFPCLHKLGAWKAHHPALPAVLPRPRATLAGWKRPRGRELLAPECQQPQLGSKYAAQRACTLLLEACPEPSPRDHPLYALFLHDGHLPPLRMNYQKPAEAEVRDQCQEQFGEAELCAVASACLPGPCSVTTLVKEMKLPGVWSLNKWQCVQCLPVVAQEDVISFRKISTDVCVQFKRSCARKGEPWVARQCIWKETPFLAITEYAVSCLWEEKKKRWSYTVRISGRV